MIIEALTILILSCLLSGVFIFFINAWQKEIIKSLTWFVLFLIVVGAILSWTLSFGTRSYIITYGPEDDKKEIRIG